MNASSKDFLTWVETFVSTGSFLKVAAEPPRSSSQLADQVIFVSRPVSSDFGRATGVCSWAGASVSGNRGET